jgi:predicted P-loop ATPase
MSEEEYSDYCMRKYREAREESWRKIQAQARASRDIEQEKLTMRWASITSEVQFNRIRAGEEDLPELPEEDEALFQ